MPYDDDDDFYNHYYRSRSNTRPRKRMAPNGVHVPNKDEATLLRKLMSESGLSEAEVREHKKYRVMLSEAQKEGVKATKTPKEKAKIRIMKAVTKQLKLAKEHPLVVEEFNKRWKEHCKNKFYY